MYPIWNLGCFLLGVALFVVVGFGLVFDLDLVGVL